MPPPKQMLGFLEPTTLSRMPEPRTACAHEVYQRREIRTLVAAIFTLGEPRQANGSVPSLRAAACQAAAANGIFPPETDAPKRA